METDGLVGAVERLRQVMVGWVRGEGFSAAAHRTADNLLVTQRRTRRAFSVSDRGVIKASMLEQYNRSSMRVVGAPGGGRI